MKRIAQGRCGGGPPRSPSEFELYQSPDVDDRIMSRFLPELKKRLAAVVVETPPAQTVIELRAIRPPSPGSETGLIGTKKLGDVRLSFDILAEPEAIFLAKIHQQEQRNQASDSYH